MQKWLNWFSQNLRCILQSIQLGILATCHNRISFEMGVAKRTQLKNGRYRARYWFYDKNSHDRNYKLLAFDFQRNRIGMNKSSVLKFTKEIVLNHVNFWKQKYNPVFLLSIFLNKWPLISSTFYYEWFLPLW